MLTEKRHSEILQMVGARGSVTVQELKEILHASESTIRRDLNELHERGELIKVFGGAVRADGKLETTEAHFSEKENLHREEKQRIAAYAAGLIAAEDFVYIDAGTTTAQMLPYIREKRAIYVTNAAEHARMLAEAGCRVIILGGELRSVTEAIVGEEAYAVLQKYHFTKGFFGTNGIDKRAGFTTPDPGEARIKECAFRHCKTRYVLGDSSKFRKIAPVSFGAFEDAEVITDAVPEYFADCANIHVAAEL